MLNYPSWLFSFALFSFLIGPVNFRCNNPGLIVFASFLTGCMVALKKD